MNDRDKPPVMWDLPVVRALDAIRLLHGLERSHVGFDEPRLHGEAGNGPMYTAVIHAYAPPTSVPYTVRFAVQGTTFIVRDHNRQPLTASGVADVLHLPLANADRAVTLLKTALTESLRIYNQAHTPPPSGAGPHGVAAGPSEPSPFHTRSVIDTAAGPHL